MHGTVSIAGDLGDCGGAVAVDHSVFSRAPVIDQIAIDIEQNGFGASVVAGGCDGLGQQLSAIMRVSRNRFGRDATSNGDRLNQIEIPIAIAVDLGRPGGTIGAPGRYGLLRQMIVAQIGRCGLRG